MVADFLHVLHLYTAKQTVVAVRRVVGRESGGGFWPCRGGEVGESARLGEMLQSANLDSGDGLLRRMGDAARSQTFYTFSPSTRLNKNGLGGLPCRGGEVGESARRSAITQSSNLGCGDGLLRRLGDVESLQV